MHKDNGVAGLVKSLFQQKRHILDDGQNCRIGLVLLAEGLSPPVDDRVDQVLEPLELFQIVKDDVRKSLAIGYPVGSEGRLAPILNDLLADFGQRQRLASQSVGINHRGT